MWTLKMIEAEFDNACNSQGVTRTSPISINGRLTRTLGRVCGKYNTLGGVDNTKVEFSKLYLETATDDCIRQTILHEAAHYIVNALNPTERHGHDKTFREMCAAIGCTEDRSKSNVDYTEEGITLLQERKKRQTAYKYALYCPCCGKRISFYKTKCKAVKEYYNYKCKTCGCDELELENL